MTDDDSSVANWPSNLRDADQATLNRTAAQVIEAQAVALLGIRRKKEDAEFQRRLIEPLIRELTRRADELDGVSPDPRGNA